MSSAQTTINHPEHLHKKAHRESALDSKGGASINGSSNFGLSAFQRPETFSFEAHFPFVRDPDAEHSGWGLSLGAYVSKELSNEDYLSENVQSFEIAFGRIKIVDSFANSTGLQGFFESGYAHTIVESTAAPFKSFFIRIGAKSHRGGKGIVDYKPYKIDQSLITNVYLPIDNGDTHFSIAHKSFIKCFSKYLDCGTSLKYMNTTNTLNISDTAVPNHWLEYGLHANVFLNDKKYILTLSCLWDAINKSDGPKWHFLGTPSLQSKFSIVF